MSDTTSDDKDLLRFVTKNWVEVYDQLEKIYNVKNEIRIKTPMLRSDLCDLCDLCDAHIVVKWIIAVTETDNAKRNKSVTFKNNAPFINCISKTNGVQIDNVEDLDLVVSMYNLLEYTIEKQQEACGIVTENNQLILFLLVLNLLNKRKLLQEIIMILVLMKLVMMQAKLVKMKLKLPYH